MGIEEQWAELAGAQRRFDAACDRASLPRSQQPKCFTVWWLSRRWFREFHPGLWFGQSFGFLSIADVPGVCVHQSREPQRISAHEYHPDGLLEKEVARNGLVTQYLYDPLGRVIEKQFLDKIKNRLEISDEEYNEILENPTKYPINAPVMHIQRLERLYDLSRMVYADHILGPKQKETLTKFALALGFTPGNITYIVDKALSLLMLEADLDTFLYEMQHMNK